MVSTLIDSIFGGDDMLPFDIKQTCRLIFDGAGKIVFKQEWEDNYVKQLALVTGADHPLHGSSIRRLMGTDPTMITPQAQAEGLQVHEVMITTRAAREAIRSASKVIARPSPWSTIKQNESESFTQFVDRLQAALDSSALPPEAKGPMLADRLHQQCNSATKDILRSLPPRSRVPQQPHHERQETCPKTSGIEPTKIYLPFCKQLSTQSTTISEYLAMALAGFGGEIRYAAKPPWTQLLTVVNTDPPPKIIDRPQAGPTIFMDASSLTSIAAAVRQSEKW
ncbi:hypothetical protein TURU_004533 [Turdus rufiventris]|nr:hypothetical protein TURU_004533 [Turdus rufiventris]